MASRHLTVVSMLLLNGCLAELNNPNEPEDATPSPSPTEEASSSSSSATATPAATATPSPTPTPTPGATLIPSTTLLKQSGNVTIGANAAAAEKAKAIVVDSSGNTYIAGTTAGNVYEGTAGGVDAIVIKYLADGTVDWDTQLGGTALAVGRGTGDEIVTAIDRDSSGNIYIAGYTDGAMTANANGGSQDVFVAKLSSAGTLTWALQLDSVTIGGGSSGMDLSGGLKVDSNGDVIISGSTSGALFEANAGATDVFVAKISAAGTLSTGTQLGNVTIGANASGNQGIGSSTDLVQAKGNGIYLNSSDQIFTAFYTTGALFEANGGSADLAIAKFSSALAYTSGLQLGNVTIGAGASGLDIPYGITGSGTNLYITARTAGDLAETNAGSGDVFVAKIPQTLASVTWSEQLGSTTAAAATGDEIPHGGINVDSYGNVLVAFETTSSFTDTLSGAKDLAYAKWDSSGNLKYIQQFGTNTLAAAAAGSDVPGGFGLDTSGNIYLGVTTTGAMGEANAGSTDIGLLKTGQLYVRQSAGGDRTSGDYAYTTVFDSTNNRVIIAGGTNGALAGAPLNAGMVDAWVGSYNADGTQAWIKQWNAAVMATATLSEQFNAAVISGTDLFLAGQTASDMYETQSGVQDALIVKLDLAAGGITTGAQIGTTTELAQSLDATASETVTGIAKDSSGNIYIVGYTAGNLKEANGGGDDIFIAKYTSGLVFTAIKHLGTTSMTGSYSSAGSDNAIGIVIDPSDNIFIAGHSDGAFAETNAGGSDIILIKMNTALAVQAITQLGATTVGTGANNGDTAAGIAYNATTGYIVVAGTTKASLGDTINGTKDIFLANFTSAGALVNIRQLGANDPNTSGTENATGIAIDSSGNIFISGTTTGNLGATNAGNADAFVAKFDANGSTYRGARQLGSTGLSGVSATGNDYLPGIALDSTGNPYAVGYTDGGLGATNAGSYDVFLFMPSPVSP